MFGENKAKLEMAGQQIRDLDEMTEIMRQDIDRLKEKRNLSDDLGARVSEIELKMAKLWSLLVDVSPYTNKEKLTKFGRKFGGRAKDHIR